jgi:hypothetical protein
MIPTLHLSTNYYSQHDICQSFACTPDTIESWHATHPTYSTERGKVFKQPGIGAEDLCLPLDSLLSLLFARQESSKGYYYLSSKTARGFRSQMLNVFFKMLTPQSESDLSQNPTRDDLSVPPTKFEHTSLTCGNNPCNEVPSLPVALHFLSETMLTLC